MKRCLFILDDDFLVLRSLTRALGLKLPDWEIKCSIDPVLAAHMAFLQGQTPFPHVDVLLSDYRMSDKDGLWVLRRWAKCAPSTARFLMSGDDYEVITAYAKDADDLIDRFYAKPIDCDLLVNTLGG